MKKTRVGCPGCDRVVWAEAGRYETHHPDESGETRYCFMSGMPQPVVGHTDDSMKERARIVACLAVEVQDSDPVAVWRYLQVVPDKFVRELLQLALAALPVEGKRIEDVWKRWDIA